MSDTVKRHAKKLIQKFNENGMSSEVIGSATEICQFILRNPCLCESHTHFLLRYVQCIISESHGKFTTRYRSKKVIDKAKNFPDDEKIQHDHVFTVESISRLMQNDFVNFNQYLNIVTGCVVLKQEHDILSSFDKKCIGWERYKKANVIVYDMKYGQLLDIDSVVASQEIKLLRT